MKNIEIIKCDLYNPEHEKAEIELMRIYMNDKMGDHTPLSDQQNKQLIDGLKKMPTAMILLARYNGQYVGLTNSFVGFSTFAVKKLINIHDVIVHPNYRGLGIGKALIQENIRIASHEMDCAKITLEVRHDNSTAQNLYKSLGFKECDPKMFFWALNL